MAETKQTPLYKPDDKSTVYDNRGYSNPLSGSGLKSQESAVGKDDSLSEGSQSNDIPGLDQQTSADSLSKAESGDGFYNKSSSARSALTQGIKAGAGGEVSMARAVGKRLAGFFVAHKKGTAAGGGIIGIFVFLAIFGAGFLVSHELITIEKTLVKYEFKVEKHFEQKAASKIMQRIVCMKAKTCGKGTDPDNPAEDADENTVPAANAPDETLSTDMEDFPITEPAVVADLANAGITETTSSNGTLALKNSEGEDITDKIATNSDAADSVESGLQEWNVGQVEAFVPTITEESGSNFNPSTTPDPLDNNKSVVGEIEDGATETELVQAADTSDSEQVASNSSDTLKSDVTAAQPATSETEQILTEANKDEQAGMTTSQVESDISSETANLGTPLLANTAVQDVCSVDKLSTNASKSRVPKIETLLIRHGTLLISLADELKSGGLTGGVVSKVMGLLNGNSSATPTTNPVTHVVTPSQDTLPFSSSAAYQSASGGSGGVPIDNSSLPTASAGSAIVSDVNSGLKDTGVAPIACDVENSPVGSIAGTLLNGMGLLVGGLSLGATELIQTSAIIGFQYTLSHVIIPDILKYFTPLGLDGLENSVQWLNNSDAGLNLASGNYARSIGANPVPNSTAGQVANEATQQQNIAESHLSLVDRTLALSNTDSLASRLITHMPIGIAATINSATNYLTSIPATLIHNLSTVFEPRVFASTTPATPGVVYGVTQYAFTDGEVDKYDPIQNEQYLFTNVSFNNISVQRIAALGNPNTDIVNTSGDEIDGSNLIANDLLHCYLDNYADLQENTLSGNGGVIDSNCGSIGDYDYTANQPADLADEASALDSTILDIYCTAMNAPPGSKYYNGWTDSSGIYHSGCNAVVTPQISDDIGHFRQYILDVHVMKDYMSLTTNQ